MVVSFVATKKKGRNGGPRRVLRDTQSSNPMRSRRRCLLDGVQNFGTVRAQGARTDAIDLTQRIE